MENCIIKYTYHKINHTGGVIRYSGFNATLIPIPAANRLQKSFLKNKAKHKTLLIYKDTRIYIQDVEIGCKEEFRPAPA